jgi:hypothetical protein
MAAQWESSNLGRRLLRAWDDEVWDHGKACVFLVVKSFEVYQELERLNGTEMCRWLSPSSCAPRGESSGNGGVNDIDIDIDNGDDDEDDDAMSIATIQTDAACPSLGVIRLGVPRFLFEKKKAGLPACFLFGRKSAVRRVDVVLGAGSKTSLSRVHFALGLKNNTWAVRNMCDFETEVNKDIPLGPGTPGFALWPERGNLIHVADLEFELYCREPSLAASYLADNYSIPPPTLPFDGTVSSGASSRTTVGPPQDPDAPSQRLGTLDIRRYILEHETLESRTGIWKFLALDAWTCARYVAKQYSPSQEPAARRRLDLLSPLPVSGLLRTRTRESC